MRIIPFRINPTLLRLAKHNLGQHKSFNQLINFLFNQRNLKTIYDEYLLEKEQLKLIYIQASKYNRYIRNYIYNFDYLISFPHILSPELKAEHQVAQKLTTLENLTSFINTDFLTYDLSFTMPHEEKLVRTVKIHINNTFINLSNQGQYAKHIESLLYSYLFEKEIIDTISKYRGKAMFYNKLVDKYQRVIENYKHIQINELNQIVRYEISLNIHNPTYQPQILFHITQLEKTIQSLYNNLEPDQQKVVVAQKGA